MKFLIAALSAMFLAVVNSRSHGHKKCKDGKDKTACEAVPEHKGRKCKWGKKNSADTVEKCFREPKAAPAPAPKRHKRRHH